MSWRSRKIGVQILALAILGTAAEQPACGDYPNKVLDSQPLGLWRMNEVVTPSVKAINSGTAGAALDGSYHNSVPGAAGASELPDGTPLAGMGFRNRAFDVGGQDSYLEVPVSVLSGLQAFTLSGWINPRSFADEPVGLIGQHDAIELGFESETQLQLRTAGGGTLTWTFDPLTEVVEGGWAHIAAVGTGTSLQLYLNGQLVGSGGVPIGAHYGVSNRPVRMGSGIFETAGDQFMGTLDDMAIWNRALSAETIQAQFEAALGANRLGDFNGNDRFDVDDVNLLEEAIFVGSDDMTFDVTQNGSIDEDDLNFWVRDIAITYFGDANMNGEFSSGDFVLVFQTGEYEDNRPENSRWEEGDWNADRDFSSADFVTAFQDGGFELGPVQAQAVPEPAGILGTVCGAAFVVGRWRRRMPLAH